MAESFLEEQLKRIQRLTEQVSQVRNRAVELSDELSRERDALRHDPLKEVRDYRQVDSNEPHRHSARKPRTNARESSHRRRHR